MSPDVETGFSPLATEMLMAYYSASPRIGSPLAVPTQQIVRYLSGALSSRESLDIELAAVIDVEVRLRLASVLPTLANFRETPLSTLLTQGATDRTNQEVFASWMSIILIQLETFTGFIDQGGVLTWPMLATLSTQGENGRVAANSVRRALSTTALPARRSSTRLGYGYRLGSRGATDSTAVVTRLDGFVNSEGDIEVSATFELGPREGTAFFALAVNGRSLPLASTTFNGGTARITLKGLAVFMNLESGPIPQGSLSVRLDDWPENAKVGAVIVESDGGVLPEVHPPAIKDGFLQLECFFEVPQMDGEWELLVATSPNTWQLLAQFDITSLTERPQTLLAKMPNNAKEGPFGGALWFRRVGPRKS